jgi:hypothetical protein
MNMNHYWRKPIKDIIRLTKESNGAFVPKRYISHQRNIYLGWIHATKGIDSLLRDPTPQPFLTAGSGEIKEGFYFLEFVH